MNSAWIGLLSVQCESGAQLEWSLCRNRWRYVYASLLLFSSNSLRHVDRIKHHGGRSRDGGHGAEAVSRPAGRRSDVAVEVGWGGEGKSRSARTSS